MTDRTARPAPAAASAPSGAGRFAEFAAQARAGGGIVPVTRQVVLDGDTPVTAFAKLHRGAYGFLLESLEGGERWARYTFLATDPREVFRYRGRTCERWTAAGGWRVESRDVAPLEHLGRAMRRYSPVEVPGLPRFTGGAVGYIGYDIVRTIESLPAAPPDDRELPDALLMVADTLLVLDNLYNRATVIASAEVAPASGDAELRAAYAAAEARIEDWLARLATPGTMGPLPVDLPAARPRATSPYPDERFKDHVRRIKEYIAAGDTFQTVLSRRLDLPAPDPFLTYRYLRALNPAPYLYYLHCDDVHVVGSSPEILVRVEDREVTLRPIAGTRPRGDTPEHDAALAAELEADPKERAEHLMLVDLGRNDVGRVAEFGSVHLTAFMTIERYSHVMHLVSEVRGRLRPELDAVAALAASFPAGTVSGAPKVRAMQIIDELEPVRRGPYAGAVGYVGWGAQVLDTAIALRTVIMRGDRAWVQAGAGIVADSDPELEWKETEAKARAVVLALALAAAHGGAAPARGGPPEPAAAAG
ncbi:MAG TPA: anthranilate synthase component I [Gemmatimonadales bacterium]|nr:anthranilate synthase component I [Gemmatimonadales bacterium]